MAPGNTAQYNREYYRKHKKKILTGRKIRYRSDRVYRSAIINRAKASSVLRVAENRISSSTVEHDKREERTFTLTELSERIGRHKTVIFRWRKNGYMPRPIYFEGSKRAKGIYSSSQMNLLALICRMVDEGDLISYAEMGAVLKRLWKKKFDKGETILTLAKVKSRSKGVNRGNKNTIKKAVPKKKNNRASSRGNGRKERKDKARPKKDGKVRR